jgi:hypothetical protein
MNQAEVTTLEGAANKAAIVEIRLDTRTAVKAAVDEFRGVYLLPIQVHFFENLVGVVSLGGYGE